ncbi:MAG: response regulator transcription factor [Oligoflexia bacterium]|nr:response regulator transcription factor [Oligoflexia bacterium]
MSAPRVLIVEDERDIRELIGVQVKREGYACDAVESGEEGLAALKRQTYDLVILDWMLPGLSGTEICRRIRAEDSVLPVLMVTARAGTADVVAGLEAGADDYLVKPFAVAILIARIRALLRRKESATGPSGILRLGRLELDQRKHEVRSDGQSLELTASEFKLLVALMRNEGRVLSREKLIDLVQGEEVFVTQRSIDTHVFGLRKKLGSSGGFIETVRGVGYRIRSEERQEP